jgi:Rieske Fe-S protein
MSHTPHTARDHARGHDCARTCGLVRPDGSPAMDRRAFLSTAATVSVTLALVACGDGQIGGVTAPMGLSGADITVNLADFPALATVGGVARVTTTGAPIAVYRAADATYQAFAMACPHSGTTVDITATGFLCPNHDARFAKDGTWLGGQRTTALVSIPTTYDAVAGTLLISGAGVLPPGGGGGDDDDDDDDLRVP